METSGMVHALKIIHQLLETDGLLVDIRPAGILPLVEVHSGEQIEIAGKMDHRTDFESVRQAGAAIEQAIERGLFTRVREGTFPFLYYADTLHDLRDWLASNWSNYVLDEETARRAEALLKAAGKASRVAVRRDARLVTLKPLDRKSEVEYSTI